MNTRVIPDTLDYAKVHGLSAEVAQKLAEHRPSTLGQAARIAGVTPAAISLLLVHLTRHARSRAEDARLSAWSELASEFADLRPELEQGLVHARRASASASSRCVTHVFDYAV